MKKLVLVGDDDLIRQFHELASLETFYIHAFGEYDPTKAKIKLDPQQPQAPKGAFNGTHPHAAHKTPNLEKWGRPGIIQTLYESFGIQKAFSPEQAQKAMKKNGHDPKSYSGAVSLLHTRGFLIKKSQSGRGGQLYMFMKQPPSFRVIDLQAMPKAPLSP